MNFNEIDTGKILKTIRKHAGLTQEELAHKLNTGQSTISKIERNETTMYLDFLMECAKMTGTQEMVVEMLFGKEVAEKAKELMLNVLQTDN
ncbi:helix-turn-helix transcriptional regulator [Lysinibacillus sp. Bpr_S20]|uniref:helix-turn-helix domain-containing protein n=1 Tax=Lysinibacillus sp. Bpr_S20 TaxID=2933964 RepID=UPI0020129EA5|nr:helix-turn-helix transcriptional regulator [Lysinibacillus sp. Bpr_S20]MCL1701188.1 helix-turn-helix domain-containing protein [Lysinibacillus sp. Bpr_S20]